jgi:hypothetical protein
MPILPPSSSAPYDDLTTILNAARVRLNDRLDSIEGLSGKILENSQPFTQQCVNNAWRKFQRRLANLGYSRLKGDVLIQGLPVVGSQDPATQAYLAWTGYNDGVNYFPTPQLPSDLIMPIKIWERTNGINAMFGRPMDMALDGLPSRTKQQFNHVWEWREDAIWMPGAMLIVDIRVNYRKYLPDFLDEGTARWWQNKVPISQCMEPFSLYIVAEFLGARGDYQVAKSCEEDADSAMHEVMNLELDMKQRVNTRRRSRSGRGNTVGFGWI